MTFFSVLTKWRRVTPSVSHSFLCWFKYSLKHSVNNASMVGQRNPSWVGSCKTTSTRRERQTLDMSAYLFVVRTEGAKVSIGWSLLTCVSSATEPRKPDLRILFPIQTDITTGETGIEVKFMLVKFSQYWKKPSAIFVTTYPGASKFQSSFPGNICVNLLEKLTTYTDQ